MQQMRQYERHFAQFPSIRRTEASSIKDSSSSNDNTFYSGLGFVDGINIMGRRAQRVISGESRLADTKHVQTSEPQAQG